MDTATFLIEAQSSLDNPYSLYMLAYLAGLFALILVTFWTLWRWDTVGTALMGGLLCYLIGGIVMVPYLGGVIDKEASSVVEQTITEQSGLSSLVPASSSIHACEEDDAGDAAEYVWATEDGTEGEAVLVKLPEADGACEYMIVSAP